MKDAQQGRQWLTRLLHRRITISEKIVSLLLAILVIGSSFVLMIVYSRNSFNDIVTSNKEATSQVQISQSRTAAAAPTKTAAIATQNTTNAVITHTTATTVAKVNATARAQAPSTPVPLPPSNRTLVLDDSLNEVNSIDQWAEDVDSTGNCSFTNGSYQIVASASSFEYCLAKRTNFTNFIYQVQMTILTGNGGGLILRAPKEKTFYRFLVTQDGSYQFAVFDLKHSTAGLILSSGNNSAINIGLNTPNVLAIIAHGNIFELYVNQTRIAVVGDNSYKDGLIGLFAQYDNTPTTVIFKNARVWI